MTNISVNNTYFINRAKAVAVSGHRSLASDFNRELLEKTFIILIENGFDTFLVGMAVGFDTECFKILEKIREQKNIKIIACIPCRHQDLNFNFLQKREYRKMLDVADEKILLQEEYDNYCMLKRNKFMVDNCSTLITYLRKTTGGTAYTERYAHQKNVPVIKI
jgi:uncharacterized phage-like protein YoqJ